MPGNYGKDDTVDDETQSRESSDDDEDEDDPGKIPSDTSGQPDSQISSSFSKLMAEVGGAWRIFIFMSFTASLFAFIYMVILRFVGGIIIWVSNCRRVVTLTVKP